MKAFLKNFAILAAALGATSYAYAACNGGSACELPTGNGSAGSWTASASGMTGIQNLDSVGPNGNQAGSRYFFAATNSNLGATVAKGGISTTGDGTQVIGSFALNSGSTPGSTVTGGVVQQLLGGQTYFFYAEACPSGALLDSANCSQWAQIGSKSSLAYPVSPNVFGAPAKPADASMNSIDARTTLPNADLGNISQMQFEVDNLITGGLNQTGILIGWPGVNQSNPIDSLLYTAGGGFIPNTKYQYKGQVFYPYGVAVPTLGPQTVGPFWTTPALPGNVTTSNVTHCSAQITAANSSGNPANPSYTVYNLCATPTSGPSTCQTNQISGGTSGDTAVATLTGLNPGTSYTPNGQAQVGNGDGSQGGWNSSAVKNGSGFLTLAWGGTFTVTAVNTGGATFNVSGLTGAGSIASWAIQSAGSNFITGVGDPTGAHQINGLIPNTTYGPLTIVLTETSGCSSTLSFSPASFTTTPFAPTAGSITSNGPRALVANFTDGSPNPTVPATTYEVQVCLDAGFTSGCTSTTGTKAAGASQAININSGIIPETQYFAQVRTQNRSRPTWPDSGWLNLGSVTTPNEAPHIVSISHTVFTSSATLSANVTDNGAANQLVYHWTVTASPGGAVTSFTVNDANAANPTLLNFNPTGAYTVQLVVRDRNDTGLTDTGTDSFSPGQTATSIDPIQSPNGTTVVVGLSKSFNAIVRDQFGNAMNGQNVTWGVSNGAASRAPTLSTFTIVTGVDSTLSPVFLTASLPGLADSTLQLTVLPSGPHFTQSPSMTVNSDGLTGSVSALASDNSPGAGSMIYTWSLENGPSGATVGISPNGTSSANNAALTFNKAGSYILRCTISDNFASDFALTPSVPVPQLVTTINVCPAGISSCSSTTPITVKALQDQQFTATGLDQFKNSMNLSIVTWNVTGCPNCVSGSGVFRSGIIGQLFTIVATDTNSGKTGRAQVNLVDYNVSNAVGYPVPYKASSGLGHICFSGLGSSSKIRIYTTSGRQVYSMSSTLATDCTWNVKNSSGESLASGVYFFVVESPEGKKNGKLIIIQ